MAVKRSSNASISIGNMNNTMQNATTGSIGFPKTGPGGGATTGSSFWPKVKQTEVSKPASVQPKLP